MITMWLCFRKWLIDKQMYGWTLSIKKRSYKIRQTSVLLVLMGFDNKKTLNRRAPKVKYLFCNLLWQMYYVRTAYTLEHAPCSLLCISVIWKSNLAIHLDHISVEVILLTSLLLNTLLLCKGCLKSVETHVGNRSRDVTVERYTVITLNKTSIA